MSCRFEDDLTAYADGELRPDARQLFDAHLPGCEGCASALSSIRRAQAALAMLPEPRPSPAMRRAVLSRLDEPAPRDGSWLREALSARRLAVTLGGAAAAAGLVIAVQLQQPDLKVSDPAQLELAANLELLEDFEVVGLESPEDLDVVRQLHELEGLP